MVIKNKTIFLLVIIILIILGIYYLEKTKIKIPLQETKDQIQTNILEELKDSKYKKAPELVGISGYLNTEEININNFTNQGKVVLIDFWTYTCINCIRTIPYLSSWYDKYKDRGLVIIGVHTPEFSFEKDYENLKIAVEKYKIKYPVVQDNDYLTWKAFNNHYWPRKYLIDKDGYIRYDHIGEGGYEETEEKIQELLSEIGSDTKDIEIAKEKNDKIKFFVTREIYGGYKFALPNGQNIGNNEGLQPEKIIEYNLPEKIDVNRIYLIGRWKSNPDDLQLIGEDGSIVLSFYGNSANFVAKTLSDNIEVEVFIDGNYITKEMAGNDVKFNNKAYIDVDSPQLYNFFNGEYGNYKLTLKINSKDFALNSFTFG